MKPKQDNYKKFSTIDIIVVIISVIALAVLILVVKYYNDRSKMEQQQLVDAGSEYQGINHDRSLLEMYEFLVINEVNQTGWIELYNNEKNAGIELSNCYITVNSEKKYTFNEGDVINAGEFLCVDGLGKLGSTGHDIIGIYDENGNNLKNLLLPSLTNGESYGCKSDGAISYCYITASKERTNSEDDIIIKDKLAFSVPGGFYSESFYLEISAAEGTMIYYTLDGTEPTEHSEVYIEPILIENKSGSNMRYALAEGSGYYTSYRPTSISMGMVVRAMSVDTNGISSEIQTQSYFVGLKNASDIKNLPVLSIVTAPENLFDYFEGIYVSGRYYEDALARGEDGSSTANYLNGWEKEVDVEYFEPQKDKTYEGKMAISIIRDLSITFPQKSLLLTAEGGAFAGSSLINYYNQIGNRLTVQTNRKDSYYKIREYLAGKLLEETTVGTPDIMPCIVFINGEYWGGYMLKADYDEKYINRHYGVDEDDVIIAENGIVTNKVSYQQEYKELYEFVVNNDLREDENYAWVKAHIDVQNYLEYFCANMYLANADYGLGELVMWRTINEQGPGYEDGRWRFLMPGLDNTMKNAEAGKAATSTVNTFLQPGVSQDIFFQSLLQNEEFKNQLLMTMTEMTNSIFTMERADSSISEISVQLKKMTVMSFRRFFSNQGDTFYINEIDKIKSFFQERSDYILRYTEEVIRGGGIGNVEDAISE